MATRKKAEAETVETVATTETVTTEAAVEETTQEVDAKDTATQAIVEDARDKAYAELSAARCSAGVMYFEKSKELIDLDHEVRKAGLEKCLKLFQTISDTPSNDIQIRQIEQVTELYKALTNNGCY